MPYRSRKQDRDQQIAKRVADSYKNPKRPRQHKPDPEVLEILQQNTLLTWEEAVDELIRVQLAGLAN